MPVTHSTTEFTCEAEGRGKTCKSKAGLAIHKKRMHKMMQTPIEITCAHCRRIFKQEATWKNHQKTCKGEEVDGKRFKCGVCGLWRNKANRARTHNNTPVHQNIPTPARTYRNKKKTMSKLSAYTIGHEHG